MDGHNEGRTDGRSVNIVADPAVRVVTYGVVKLSLSYLGLRAGQFLCVVCMCMCMCMCVRVSVCVVCVFVRECCML
jgi:hypothetical protein